RSNNCAFQDQRSTGCSAAGYVRNNPSHAVFDAALDERPPHRSRHESCIDLDIFAFDSEFVRSSLRISCDCPLACANLRVGTFGLGLGPSRDISLGSHTSPGDRHLRKDHIQYLTFPSAGERSLTWVRAERFRIWAAP